MIALCSIALGRPAVSTLAVLGEISISGTIMKVDELANSLQVCLDSGAKKVLDHNSLDDRKQSDRIYTAKVSIYKAGAAEKGFPESDRIAVLDSANED